MSDATYPRLVCYFSGCRFEADEIRAEGRFGIDLDALALSEAWNNPLPKRQSPEEICAELGRHYQRMQNELEARPDPIAEGW